MHKATGKVIYLQRCELCGRMATSDICRKCEPMFLRWKRIMFEELKREEAKTKTEKNRHMGGQPDAPIIA